MKEVLEKHIGTTIGINIERAYHLDATELLAVHDTYFSVRPATDQHIHHIPYFNVLKVIEDDKGVEIRHVFTANERFKLIVKIGHVVVHTVT